MKLLMESAIKFFSNDHIICRDGINISGHCYGEWRQLCLRKLNNDYHFTIYKLNPVSRRPVSRIAVMHGLKLNYTSEEKLEWMNGSGSVACFIKGCLLKEITWKHGDREVIYKKAPTPKALKYIDVSLENDLESLEPYWRNGLVERYQAMIESFEEKSDLAEYKAKYYLWLGRAHLATGNYVAAKAALAQTNLTLTLARRPGMYEPIYWFGRVYEIEGGHDKAAHYYRLALDQYRNQEGDITKNVLQLALKRALAKSG